MVWSRWRPFKPVLRLCLENPTGQRRKDALRLDFDRKLKVEFHGTKVTIDAHFLAYQELDKVLGLTMTIESELTDNRTGKNTQYGLSVKLPRKRDCLTVQGNFVKIIDVVRKNYIF